MMEEEEDHFSDLRSFIHGGTGNGRPAISASLFPATTSGHHDMLIFQPANANPPPPPPPPQPPSAARDAVTGRWPRQETLALLEIRASLDSKFKETNQKGPLWDQVSRIMSEQHGYQRSGKKCREKFENLYKYYKKIKERKAGRHDGKRYRFFRQLEALYGDSYNYASTSNQPASFMETSLSLSNYSEADASSSEEGDDDDADDTKNKTLRRWKSRMKDFIDANMKKLVDKQEAWMDKMMRAIEDKDRERIQREEEWRRKDAARIEQEQEQWARERVLIEARDLALMEALHKLAGKEQQGSLGENQQEDRNETMTNRTDNWSDSEINELIRLRTSMEMKFQQRMISESVLWEEIAVKLSYFGHATRTPLMCKEKWDCVCNEQLKGGGNKKRKEEPKMCTYYEPFAHQGGAAYVTNEGGYEPRVARLSDRHGNSSPNTAAATLSESCFRYLMGDGYGRIID